jgi:hypothetical protein
VRVGLLWFDNDPKKGLDQRLEEAVERYRTKVGQAPNTCYVNPSELHESQVSRPGIRIVAASNILRSHLWVGLDEEAAARIA